MASQTHGEVEATQPLPVKTGNNRTTLNAPIAIDQLQNGASLDDDASDDDEGTAEDLSIQKQQELFSALESSLAGSQISDPILGLSGVEASLSLQRDPEDSESFLLEKLGHVQNILNVLRSHQSDDLKKVVKVLADSSRDRKVV